MAILNELLQEPTPTSNIIEKAEGGKLFSWGIAKDGALKPDVIIFNAAVILLWTLAIGAALTFLYAGFKYLTAGADAEKAESAKKIIIGSIIGMILIMGSYLIFNTAVKVLNGENNIETPQEAQEILDTKY